MADLPISGLPVATTPLGGTEPVAIVQAGETRQVAVQNITPHPTLVNMQVVFGGASGEMDQAANFTFDSANTILKLGLSHVSATGL